MAHATKLEVELASTWLVKQVGAKNHEKNWQAKFHVKIVENMFHFQRCYLCGQYYFFFRAWFMLLWHTSKDWQIIQLIFLNTI